MLEGAKEYLEYILTVSWCSHCSYSFIVDHYSLLKLQYDAANTSMRSRAKHNNMRIYMKKSHLIQYGQSIFLLEVMNWSIGEVTDSKWEDNAGHEYCVLMNDITFS